LVQLIFSILLQHHISKPSELTENMGTYGGKKICVV
jgi:hypothetical protein